MHCVPLVALDTVTEPGCCTAAASQTPACSRGVLGGLRMAKTVHYSHSSYTMMRMGAGVPCLGLTLQGDFLE
jgi:hypothetical protein